jgi:hypothetical protein
MHRGRPHRPSAAHCPAIGANVGTEMSRWKDFRVVRLRALAEKTNSPMELVTDLYDGEVADLEANSHVKKFIHVIAARRVEQRLLRQSD